jgi:hypothetical protein
MRAAVRSCLGWCGGHNLSQVSEEKKRSGWRRRGPGTGCGGGCAGVIIVLTVGLLLSAFNTAIGVGVSARVPFTHSNLSLAGAIGQKDKVEGALPPYLEGRVAGHQNFANQTNSLTIWVAEGLGMAVLGQQDGAPIIDLHLTAQ